MPATTLIKPEKIGAYEGRQKSSLETSIY